MDSYLEMTSTSALEAIDRGVTIISYILVAFGNLMCRCHKARIMNTRPIRVVISDLMGIKYIELIKTRSYIFYQSLPELFNRVKKGRSTARQSTKKNSKISEAKGKFLRCIKRIGP